MAVTITAEEIKSLLEQMGLSIPDFLLNALIAQANATDECMDGAGYDESTQLLIKTYAIALMANSAGARRVKSQSAPSGASQSYEYGITSLTDISNLLRALDPNGCTSGLPIEVTPAIGFFDVVGGIDC